ncbi:hypothetical protein QA612_17375 [Evansella sp. AB-P1]|uniref:hypothetical protein n=1 Tax=Evansella sp. AB-P1 TaxID=3037653 RepID=UPI00241C313E|nr:hypothetical protein [Evansella sp. AB-P1]MDG5789233.1 hypothetical protein [Evansella sp. AB-P1]
MELILPIVFGLLFMILGYFIYKHKALFLINLFLWNGLDGNRDLIAKVFGTIMFVIGIVIILLPFILGTDSMNF